MENIPEKFLVLTDSLLDIAQKLPNPEQLAAPKGADVIENARKSLRLLRTLQGMNMDMENWLCLGEPAGQQAKSELLFALIEIYAGMCKIAQLANPETLSHFTIENANIACGSIALSVALHMLDILPAEHPRFVALDESLNALPMEWDVCQERSVDHLLDDLEGGLSHLANKPMGDRSPVDQLIEISEQIRQTARELYSIDTLEEPAREESIELAREILRRLKNMLFSDKPIEDAIDKGKPNDKLAFARKISEMADMYKNLLLEASKKNPDIMNDPRVQKANRAVGDSADGVALMAIKEMPTTGMVVSGHNLPKFLKREEDENSKQRSGASIVKNMEEGVECAANEIKTQKEKASSKDQDKLKDQERARASQAQARAEAAREVRRRLRRERSARQMEEEARRRQAQPAPAVRVQASAQTQQRNSENRPRTNTPQAAAGLAGLNMDAINAIRQAGATLRSSNRQATSIATANAAMADASKGAEKKNPPKVVASDVSASDKIAPDDKNFAQREQDQKNKNRGNRPSIV